MIFLYLFYYVAFVSVAKVIGTCAGLVTLVRITRI